jgi:hypothetical protein
MNKWKNKKNKKNEKIQIPKRQTNLTNKTTYTKTNLHYNNTILSKSQPFEITARLPPSNSTILYTVSLHIIIKYWTIHNIPP